MIRLTINGEMIQFSSKLQITPNNWNTQVGRANGRSATAIQLNDLLDNLKTPIIKHYHELERHDSNVTVRKLRDAFMGIDNRQESLLMHFDKHNEDIKKLIGIDHSDSTHKKYNLT